MKKTSLLVAIPAMALSALLLTGCGMFRSHKAWDTAQQESPLEIPPGLDRPSTSAALVIPPPGTGAPAVAASTSGQVADGFVLTDAVDAAYRRVGQVLEAGSLGQLIAHDDAAHSYTLSVTAGTTQEKKPGFIGRLFGRDKTTADAPGGASHQVQVSVSASGSQGSEVRAQGNAAAVAKVVDGLKSRLGG